jgi:hypothetical protein
MPIIFFAIFYLFFFFFDVEDYSFLVFILQLLARQ